ncbi:uncharacterized protein LOC115531584 [Gadus morhua]|uniref:uncharacterized protein LOC115531584 n=1 Tax=Gadus morhua TaxID=8049 RepID=UPI0011B56F7D|nr:uncharacterized protein LOC115531584 [Gadus morhua]
MVPRSRSVLQEQTVEVMEAVVWRSVAVVWRRSLQIEGRPVAVQPKGCRTVRHGTAWTEAEVLEAEVLEAEVRVAEAGLEAAVAWRSWRRPTWKGRHGEPGGGSSSKGPGGGRPGGGWPGGPGGGWRSNLQLFEDTKQLDDWFFILRTSTRSRGQAYSAAD